MVAHLGLVPGGYAEQAVTTPEKLFPVPDQVSITDAVAAVGTGRTALGVLELEPPGADDVVLRAVGGRWDWAGCSPRASGRAAPGWSRLHEVRSGSDGWPR